MSISQFARIFQRNVSGKSNLRRRPTLAFESLEDRAVPANNLTIIDGVAGVDDVNIQVHNPGNSPTVTIRTSNGGAQLTLATLQEQLSDPTVQTVIVTTDAQGNGNQDDDEDGNIFWDATVVGSLDFTDFGTGKTLIFRTVAGTNAVGSITLTAVRFLNGGSNDQISLEFDSSGTNGDITFQTDGALSDTVAYSAEAVLNLTVNAGTGAFNFSDDGVNISAADSGGSVSITAGSVTINSLSGLTAFGSLSITADGDVTLGSTTGLLASNDLTIDTTGAIFAADGGLTSENGAMSLTGTDVGLTNTFITAPNGLTIDGSTSILLDSNIYDVLGNVSLTSGGAIGINSMTLPGVNGVTISGDSVSLTDATIVAEGAIAITGSPIDLNGTTALVAEGNLTFTGPVNLQGSVSATSNEKISFTGVVDGTADLSLAAPGNVTFNDHVGPINALTSLTLYQGNMSLGAHNLSAGTVTIGQASNAIEATLGMAGTLIGNLDILETGNLAPGGLNGVGDMTVIGNVDLKGDFAVDFGTPGPADQLTVSGNVTIGPNSQLGAGLGSGTLNFSQATIIAYGGTRNGTFVNAGLFVPVLVGMDAVTVTSYGDGTDDDVVVAPFSPPAPSQGTTIFGVEDDATGFKAVLTGGGTLVTGKDWNNNLFLIARNTTILSKLTITTIANGSDDIVTFPAGVLVSGPLVTFSAPKVNIGSQFRASGPVTTATFRDYNNTLGNAGVQFGGALGLLTTISARNILGSVRVGSTLNLLKVTQALGAQVGSPTLEDSVVSAPTIVKVTARSATTNFVSTGAIKSIAFTGDYLGDIKSGAFGTFLAGSMTGDLETLSPITSFKTIRAFNGKIEAASIARFEASGGSDATLVSAGPIGTIISKGQGGLTLELDASQVGPIRVETALVGDGVDDGPDINVTNGITSMTIGSILDTELRAKFIGTVAVNGSSTYALSGDVLRSHFTLTGNDGTLLLNGLRSLLAKGNVRESRFDILDGNVATFTVGRFHDSQLYLNYTPDGGGDFTLGDFGQKKYKLGVFRTTAVPTVDPSHPLHWAFQGSEVVADSIGTLTISGLKTDNGGTDFGIKIRSGGAIVKVIKADVTNDLDLPLNIALTPDTPPGGLAELVGNFFFVDV